MKLVKGNGRVRCNCRKCGVEIYSNDWKYKATEGFYCFTHGRIESLFNGFNQWLKGVLEMNPIKWYNKTFYLADVSRLGMGAMFIASCLIGLGLLIYCLLQSLLTV